jgi:hypothetical protein
MIGGLVMNSKKTTKDTKADRIIHREFGEKRSLHNPNARNVLTQITTPQNNTPKSDGKKK